MMRRVGSGFWVGVGIIVLLCNSARGYGGAAPPAWLYKEHFRELPWGSTLEQAHTVFSNLSFVRYSVENEKEPPSKVYERKDENLKLDGIRVDEIRYWFRENSFYKVTVTLHSKLGPRTLGTPSTAAFEELLAEIRRVAGEPIEDRTSSRGWDGNRMGVWRYGGTIIHLRQIEHPESNTDEMDLEFVNTPTVPDHDRPGKTGEP